jgi:putative zinc finger/helix-turn-helix YgiT family protein
MKCPSCSGEKWKKGTVPQTLTVAGRTFKASLAARVCAKCGVPIVAHDELGRFEVAVATQLARAGTHSGQAIQFMRKAIGLPATELAALLGVQRWTLSRWETGERDAPVAAVAALGTLVLDHAADRTEALDRLRALTNGPKLAKVVRIEMKRTAKGRRASG